jgi:hypothetical protein
VKNEKGKGKAKAQDDEAGGFVEDAEMGGFLPDEEGGFLPDSGDEGGGFVPDDDAGDGGGFMVDDDDNGDGGFVPDEPTVSPRPRTATSATDQIPLGMISTLLASLGLPSDNDVLAVFKASATGWHADTEDAGESRVRKRDAEVNEDDLGVAKKNFRAVCAALMGPDNGAGDDDDAVSSEDLGAGDDEDDFTMDSQSDSSLSSLSASSFEGGKRGAKGSTRTPRKKSVGKGKSGDEGGSRKRKSKKKLLEEEGPIKLTLRQKDMVSDLWSLVKPKADKQGRAGRVLGKDEVKNLVRTLGEMWTDEEVSHQAALGEYTDCLYLDCRHGHLVLEPA